MAWEVPQFNAGAGNQQQVIQQAFSGKTGGQQGQQQGMQPLGQVMQQGTHPVAASSTDMAGNTSATQGAMPNTQAMFRQGSPLGAMFPSAQAPNMNLVSLFGFGG